MKRILAASLLLVSTPALMLTSPTHTQKAEAAPQVSKVSLKVGEIAPDSVCSVTNGKPSSSVTIAERRT